MVSTRSLTSAGPQIWNRRAVPPESGINAVRELGQAELGVVGRDAARRTAANAPTSRRCTNPGSRTRSARAAAPGSGGSCRARTRCTGSRSRPSPRLPSSLTSRPAEKARPSARQSTQYTSSRVSSSSNAAQSWCSMWSLMALSCSGRSSVRTARWPRTRPAPLRRASQESTSARSGDGEVERRTTPWCRAPPSGSR